MILQDISSHQLSSAPHRRWLATPPAFTPCGGTEYTSKFKVCWSVRSFNLFLIGSQFPEFELCCSYELYLYSIPTRSYRKTLLFPILHQQMSFCPADTQVQSLGYWEPSPAELVDLAIERHISHLENRFLERETEPFFVADLGQVTRQHTRWMRHLPNVRPYYGTAFISHNQVYKSKQNPNKREN